MTTKNIQSELNKLSFTCPNPLADIFHLTNNDDMSAVAGSSA